jgi:uncharacterized protein (TIGR03083 family)
MESDPHAWIAALRSSHERLASLVRPLTAEQLREPSYCSDWTIAQVLSHLGSSAEIGLMTIPVALGEAEPLGGEAFRPVWDSWNAKSPDEQAADCLIADERQVVTLEQLSDADLARIRLPFIGLELDAAGLIRLRLGEHALHTWDVAVSADPAATVAPDAVALLVDTVPEFIAPRLGKPQGEEFRNRIITTSPDRDYLLTVTETVSMTGWPWQEQEAAAELGLPELRMPAEALLRLAYGRLDPEHTPADVAADPADLDRLRKVFPGF